ncbi:MAG TPA: dihydropteroate synthase [Acidimicrobiia bacterium]|nr:dihydropteroate synthase [Acidimicrobiia bacterium]
MLVWSEVCGERPAVMGIVNVTPDSFSDGGRFLDPDAAVSHGLELAAAGADLLDVGGESTRPGAEPVGEDEELRRVLPVVRRLAVEGGVPVSIDTSKAAVAAAALDAGATIVNDVAAGADPDMFAAVATAGAGLVVMHMRGEPRTMQQDAHYDDVVVEVGDFLVDRLAAARDAGIHRASLCADPGLGFGKTAVHNLELLARLGELVARVDVPVLVGPSRKSFIARVLGDDLVARDDGTLATAVWAVDQGARVVRVHDAGAAADALRLLAVMDAIDAEAVA